MYKKILIFGDTGMLGSVLLKFSKNLGFLSYGCSRTSNDIRIDITDHKGVRNLLNKINPDVIINTVGLIDLDFCENNPFQTWNVNSNSIYNICEWIKKKNKKIIYISTDQFFAYSKKKKNNEEDPISLVNVYAQTKFLGELFVGKSRNHLIFRTNIIGLSKKKSFAEWVIKCIENRVQMDLFDDYKISSIDIYKFSELLFNSIEKDLTGTFNLGSREVFSKKEIILEFSKQMGIQLYKPSVKKSKFKTIRSQNCGLDVSKIEKALKKKMPNLSEVVSNVLSNYSI